MKRPWKRYKVDRDVPFVLYWHRRVRRAVCDRRGCRIEGGTCQRCGAVHSGGVSFYNCVVNGHRVGVKP